MLNNKVNSICGGLNINDVGLHTRDVSSRRKAKGTLLDTILTNHVSKCMDSGIKDAVNFQVNIGI